MKKNRTKIRGRIFILAVIAAMLVGWHLFVTHPNTSLEMSKSALLAGTFVILGALIGTWMFLVDHSNSSLLFFRLNVIQSLGLLIVFVGLLIWLGHWAIMSLTGFTLFWWATILLTPEKLKRWKTLFEFESGKHAWKFFLNILHEAWIK